MKRSPELLDYRAIGLAPRAEDIVIFFLDLFEFGLLDPENRRLLGYLAEGWTTGEIAQRLGASERTTHRRVAHLRQRLADYALTNSF